LRLGVVAVGLHPLLQPTRDLGTATSRELSDLLVVPDRHDAGYDGDVHAQALDLIHKVEVGVGVVEELGHRRIGTRRHLVAEVREVL
jgi:hypothetical protein